MCDPASSTLAIAALVSSAAGAAISTVGAIQQGNAAEAAADYEAQVAQQNAEVAQQLADDALERGKETELDARSEIAARIRAQRQALAANGILVDEGSAADLITQTAVLGEADVQTIRNQAIREAFGFKQQGVQFQQSGTLALARGKHAKTASYLNAASSLTSGVGSTIGMGFQFEKLGATSFTDKF